MLGGPSNGTGCNERPASYYLAGRFRLWPSDFGDFDDAAFVR